MKKVLFLFAIAVLAFTGCKKDDVKPSYSGNFTIDGKTYNVSNMFWFDVELDINGTSYKSYSISGGDEEDTYYLEIVLPTNTTGEKTIGEKTIVNLEVGDESYISTSGKVTVTKFDDKTASGTFECQFLKEGTLQTKACSGKFEAQVLSLGF